ncbi:acetylserotonin O-methyltransferase-like isoform X1 [Ascaphus truei]|uniref:acetylserotonin O-methyltransferase-like isoform X1 n=1 Tax=Ascaphus truei TaxID=8439 RepID=UPI003F59948E
MNSSEELDYPKQILEYKDGFLVSKTMFAACELGVFDVLHESELALSAAAVAARLGTSVNGTDRLLSACVGLKLLKAEMKNEEAFYANTDLSSIYLTKSSPRSLYHMMMYYSHTMYKCWQFLPEAIRNQSARIASEPAPVPLHLGPTVPVVSAETRQEWNFTIQHKKGSEHGNADGLSRQDSPQDVLTSRAGRDGKNQYERAFGISSKEIFDALYRSEDEMATFMHHMDSIWNICGKDVITAFDLSVFSTVYDLGGCSGGLAKQFVSVYPESTVTILDMPKVVQTAKKHFITGEEHRISFHEGDFFNDPIPQADLFIMARIIHDWTEDKCSQLLNKIYKSCKPGGGLLLVEVLLNEDKSGPLTSQLYSLNMLVQTEGKERTRTEYSKLLTASGFKDIQVKATGKIYDAILGRK